MMDWNKVIMVTLLTITIGLAGAGVSLLFKNDIVLGIALIIQSASFVAGLWIGLEFNR